MSIAFDAGAAILLICYAVICRLLPLTLSQLAQFGLFAATFAAIAVVRGIAGASSALDVSAALLIAYAAASIGRVVIARRIWPEHALAIALAIITATGTYLRAYRLSEVMQDHRPLSPDVQYYHEHALQTANPFAAGHKSPLWSAMHAPLLRFQPDANVTMRLVSWVCGVGMLALIGGVLGKLLHPLAGILTASMLAVEPWLIDLCCEGLREEAGVCLWMAVLYLLFRSQPVKPWHIGIVGGVLLLLRNISMVPLIALTGLSIFQRKWRGIPAATALLLPLIIVSPFYINQYRDYGDAFAMEKRDARYHANLEFAVTAPSNLPMPTSQEHAKDLFAGSPLSPMAYLLKYHTFRDFVSKQWAGLSAILSGKIFDSLFGIWVRLLCAAGIIASLFVTRARFIAVFMVTSVAGISAHLLAIRQLELRLLLPTMIIWLAAGMWLIASIGEMAIASRRSESSRADGNVNDQPFAS